MSAYRLAELFMLRAAGASLGELDALATPKAAELGRTLGDLEKRLDALGAEILAGVPAVSSKAIKRLESAIEARGPLPKDAPRTSATAQQYERSQAEIALRRGELETVLERETEQARRRLWELARTLLRRYAVFASANMSDRFEELAEVPAELPKRNSRTAERERHWALYLQRVCAKNDTLSEFGPAAWGTIVPGSGLNVEPESSVSARDVFYEKWVTDAVARAISDDPDARLELCPRLHPYGRLEEDAFIREDTQSAIPLRPEHARALASIGRAPAHALGIDPESLAELAARGVLLWQMEPPAMNPHRMEVMAREV